jgi:hypothetical protein
MTLLESALLYARNGWYIFPCIPGGKEPIKGSRGSSDATTNELQIKNWWMRYPDANIALRCGEKSGVHVVDVDIDEVKDVDGFESLGTFADEGKIMPETLMQMTPRGGAHYLFKTDARPNNRNDFRNGIDIRSNGYYIMLTPSIINPDGKRYNWDAPREYKWADDKTPFETPLADFPEFMRPELDKKENVWDFPVVGGGSVDMSHATKKIEVTPRNKVYGNEVLKRASLYLQECPPAVEGHGGHEKLLWAARAMVVGFSLSANEALSLLESEYNPRCSPSWDLSNPKQARDFRRKVIEVQKTPGSKPQGWLLSESGLCFDEQKEAYADRLLEGLLAQIVAKEKAKQPVQSSPTQQLNDTEWPSWLLSPPGLVGQMVSWIVESAMCPQPQLALGAALVGCGALFGRKVKDESNGRTNLYAMGVAPSSSGKDHPADCITRLFHEAGAGDLIGGSQVTSDAAIETALMLHPVQAFFMDEMGQKMEQNKGAGSSFSSSVIPTFTELYSCPAKVYKGKQKADIEPRVIDQPHACIFGLSSPDSFANSISRKELESGWLGRIIVFQSSIRSKIKLKPFSPPPEHLIQSVQAWYARVIEPSEGIGNLTGLQRAQQILVETDDEALAVFEEFNEYAWQQMNKFERDDDDIQFLWGKAFQNARRIALILATGCNFENPIINKLCANYACEVVKLTIKGFHQVIDNHVSDSFVESEKKRVLHVVRRRKGDGCSKTELTRKTQFLRDSKSRMAYIEDLIEAGLMICGPGPMTHGRQAVWYWALPYGLQQQPQQEA